MNTKPLKLFVVAISVMVYLISISPHVKSDSSIASDDLIFIDAKYCDDFYNKNCIDSDSNINYKLSSTEDVQTLIDSTRQIITSKINQVRKEFKLQTFTTDTKVQIISQRHAKWMSKNYRNSQNQYNQNPGQRLEAEGIKWWAIEEYIDVYEISDSFDVFLRDRLIERLVYYISRTLYDPELTHFGIGLYPTEDMEKLYVCIDFYTPYTDQPERKRPYAELLPNNIYLYDTPETNTRNYLFTFKNTGNTNLTNVFITIDLINSEDKDDIITKYEYNFEHILLPGQTITLSYSSVAYNKEEKNYIHTYDANQYEITEKQPPKHYFTKPFTISNDGTDVSVSGAIANISGSPKLFGGYATFFVNDGMGSKYAIGQSDTIDGIEIANSESREMFFTPSKINSELTEYVRFVEITYWLKDKQ